MTSGYHPLVNVIYEMSCRGLDDQIGGWRWSHWVGTAWLSAMSSQQGLQMRQCTTWCLNMYQIRMQITLSSLQMMMNLVQENPGKLWSLQNVLSPRRISPDAPNASIKVYFTASNRAIDEAIWLRNELETIPGLNPSNLDWSRRHTAHP